MIYIGENIKRLRHEKELTQENLAEFLGVTFQSVSKWERGESYPDITMLPSIASFFDVTCDELLGTFEAVKEERIQQYINEYDDICRKNSPHAFELMSKARREFPGEFRLTIRYLEILISTKSAAECDSELILDEVEKIYANILHYCTNDTIRMRAKRIVCMYYNTLSHKTKKEKYTKKMREISKEMPSIFDCRDYLETIINLPDEEHYTACRNALDNQILLLISTVNNQIFYKDHFSLDYKIEAIKRCLAILNTFYDDGNFGSCYRSVIYMLGNLGQFYFEKGDTVNAIRYLTECAETAKKHDNLPEENEHRSIFMEGSVYKKTKYGKTMSERMKHHILNSYSLTDEFKSTEEFKRIIEILE